MTLTFDLLTLKVVSESRVFLGLSVLDLGLMYATDVRQTDVRRQTASSLNAPPIRSGGITTVPGRDHLLNEQLDVESAIKTSRPTCSPTEKCLSRLRDYSATPSESRWT